MKPLRNKVIVEKVESDNKTAGGIILQRSEGPDFARIIAIGPEVENVSVGDVILVDWSRAVKSGDFYIVTEDDVAFVYEDYNE